MRQVGCIVVAIGMLVGGSAQAQRSLFDQTPADPSAGFTPAQPAPSSTLAPAPSAPPARQAPAAQPAPPPSFGTSADNAEPAAAPVKRRRIAKPKPKGPVAAGAITVLNGSTSIITAISIEGEGQTVSYAKDLSPDARAVIKLPKLKGCTISISPTYGTDAPAPPSEVDVCKDKVVKLTD